MPENGDRGSLSYHIQQRIAVGLVLSRFVFDGCALVSTYKYMKNMVLLGSTKSTTGH